MNPWRTTMQQTAQPLIGDRAVSTSHLYDKLLRQFPTYAAKIVTHGQIVDSKLNEVLLQLNIERGSNTTNNLFRLWRHLSNRHWLSAGELKETDDLSLTYEILAELGSGNFGTVLKAKNRYYDETVALKLFDPRRRNDGLDENSVMQWLLEEYGEIQPHKNVLGFYGSFFAKHNNKDYLVLKLQYMPGKELLAVATATPRISHQATLDIAIGIFSGLAFLHKNKIIHRDIKPENILYFAETDGVYILDLGLAQFARLDGPTALNPGKGTPYYFYYRLMLAWMDDSSHKPDNYVELFYQADIWSAALVLYILIMGEEPAYFNYVDDIDDLMNLFAAEPPPFIREMSQRLEFATPEFADICQILRNIFQTPQILTADHYLQKFTAIRYPLQTQA